MQNFKNLLEKEDNDLFKDLESEDGNTAKLILEEEQEFKELPP